jgi:hypothetical protein
LATVGIAGGTTKIDVRLKANHTSHGCMPYCVNIRNRGNVKIVFAYLQRKAIGVDSWVELFEVGVGWNKSFLKHQNSLDNAGYTTCPFEVTNV